MTAPNRFLSMPKLKFRTKSAANLVSFTQLTGPILADASSRKIMSDSVDFAQETMTSSGNGGGVSSLIESIFYNYYIFIINRY
jgi:hypothetical protein